MTLVYMSVTLVHVYVLALADLALICSVLRVATVCVVPNVARFCPNPIASVRLRHLYVTVYIMTICKNFSYTTLSIKIPIDEQLFTADTFVDVFYICIYCRTKFFSFCVKKP